jgi:catechol 2,3-dioxygenase-like lactoylglutathione lyase family enzyme
MTGSDDARTRFVGIDHVALEVADVEVAIEFYGSIFAFDIRGRTDSGTFLDVGDQFLALSEVPNSTAGSDEHRHFGLVADDPEVIERRLEAIEDFDVEVLPTKGLDFRDSWGNRFRIVAYEEIQFTKADHVLRGMGLADFEKSDSAHAELAEKGMDPD